MSRNTITVVLALILSAPACCCFRGDEARECSPVSKAYAVDAGAAVSGVSVPDVAERAVGSVVNISSLKVVRYRTSPLLDDPFFRHFFGDGAFSPFGIPKERRERSLGSGVIVSGEGRILTSHHVVAGASEVRVVLNDRTELPARIVGTDPQTDVAVLWADIPGTVKPMPMGDSDALRLGETVLAIGSPFGLGGTVTMGIVSAKGRANVGVADYEDFIQTDAAINPGNSGGALINVRGELVGINAAIYSRTGGYQGIGFAVPVNMARVVMRQLTEHGRMERGWLGFDYQDVNTEIAAALRMQRPDGAILTRVFSQGPSAGSGLVPGDVILGFNGEAVRSAGHLSKLLSEVPVGESVRLTVLKEGREVRIEVGVDRQPGAGTAPVRRR